MSLWIIDIFDINTKGTHTYVKDIHIYKLKIVPADLSKLSNEIMMLFKNLCMINWWQK